MQKKVMSWKTKGMNRDLSVSAFNPEFSFENRNLRLSTNDNNTMLSWVNEQAPKLLEVSIDTQPWIENGTQITSIPGTPIGIAVLNDQLVLFTTRQENNVNVDSIYVLEWATKTENNQKVFYLKGKRLYNGNLNFSAEHPLETLVWYEAEYIQKVYWVDGVNQPRMINIKTPNSKLQKWNTGTDNTMFDFIPELQLQETVTIKKQFGNGGIFPAGVLQYAFTYYNKYGQETNIFYTTPLCYISHNERGASPEDRVDNSFKITISDIDNHFDYVRIYSIIRTSLDATPICKRVQDVAIEANNSITFIDKGSSGDIIDPTELLYKGGETIIANTLEQKDMTLFLGNLKTTMPDIAEDLQPADFTNLKADISITSGLRYLKMKSTSVYDDLFYNQLTAYEANQQGGETGGGLVPCGGFKKGNYYRLGVQFQYKTGKWSEPIPLFDKDENQEDVDYMITDQTPSISAMKLQLPCFVGTLLRRSVTKLLEYGYKKIRPVVVFPNIQDRMVLCQGVVSPTVGKYPADGSDGHFQSSWFFRATKDTDATITDNEYTACPVSTGNILTTDAPHGDPNEPTVQVPSGKYTQEEIQGKYTEKGENFPETISRNFLTFHSPEITEDSNYIRLDYQNTVGKYINKAIINSTLSQIDIQTETPAIQGNGAYKTGFKRDGNQGIVSGLFYDDNIVIEDSGDFTSMIAADLNKWLIYTWQRTGSLNNDILRPASKGTQTAKLKKKIISNLRLSAPSLGQITERDITFDCKPQVFNSDVLSILKFQDTVSDGTDTYTRNSIYGGNINTALMSDGKSGPWFKYQKNSSEGEHWNSLFYNPNNHYGYRTYWDPIQNRWNTDPDDFRMFDLYPTLVENKDTVRMTYKSTPHLIFKTNGSTMWDDTTSDSYLPIMEILRGTDNVDTVFGGKSQDALRENNWVPCGKPVNLNAQGNVTFKYEYGDTYYQRWDCLKTYPFTNEDLNQVVEIGSFMLETYQNIDGRYDRNRGQQNNLNMSPLNFNLINPVYSQVDNFFTYKIVDTSDDKEKSYPNQITWSKTKVNGADVDLWANLTLASMLELDGDKGSISKIARFNDALITFQDKGISQILYNERTQLTTTDGVPVELANTGKVEGKRYISDTIGCSNKHSIAISPAGIYFMDSFNKSIFLFNGQLNNLSAQKGFDSWCKQEIPEASEKWTPDWNYGNGHKAFAAYYDQKNQEVLFTHLTETLAFSEKFGNFTSFYDYVNVPYFCNLQDKGIWVTTYDTGIALKQHQAGDYMEYTMTLVGNPEPTLDKIFTNLEFRACVTPDESAILPFNYLKVWNEYQEADTNLFTKTGGDLAKHFEDNAALNRRYRIWRCDIPRVTPPSGLKQWIRNPWLYLKLERESVGEETMPRVEIHDMQMIYYT